MRDAEAMEPASEIVETFCIDAAHPSLPGHFPGQPVVAGVVLLDQVAACLHRHHAGRFARLPAVKFLAPLLPNQVATLHFTLDGPRARFRILRDDATILSGEAELT